MVMAKIDLRRFERELDGLPAIVWPETDVNSQEMRLYKPPLQEAINAVRDDRELVIHVVEPEETEMYGSTERFEVTYHQVIRAIGVTAHVLLEVRAGSAYYGGILSDGTPINFRWDDNDFE